MILKSEVPIPHRTFDQRIRETDHQSRRGALRQKPCPLGDTAGNDRRDRRRERRKEEEFDELVSLPGTDRLSRSKKSDAVRQRVSDCEVDRRRDREVDENFYKCIDLIFMPDRSDFEKREPSVHREHEDRTHQKEKDVSTLLLFHPKPPACFLCSALKQQSEYEAVGRSRRQGDQELCQATNS